MKPTSLAGLVSCTVPPASARSASAADAWTLPPVWMMSPAAMKRRKSASTSAFRKMDLTGVAEESVAASSTTLTEGPVSWIVSFTLMLPWACSVSVTPVVPVDATIGAATVMFPGSPPVADVVTVTLVPPSSELTIDAASVAPIVMFVGSRSQSSARPATAPASTAAPSSTASVFLPEVSTKPPLPPCGPPRAVIVPPNTVALSDHTITVPPSPWRVASAVIVAPAATVASRAFATGPLPR